MTTDAQQVQQDATHTAQSWMEAGGLLRRLPEQTAASFMQDLALYLAWCREEGVSGLQAESYARFRTQLLARGEMERGDAGRILQRINVTVQNMAAQDDSLTDLARRFEQVAAQTPAVDQQLLAGQRLRQRQNRLFSGVFGISTVGGWLLLLRYLASQADYVSTTGDRVMSLFFILLGAAALASLAVALTAPKEILGRPFKRPPRPQGLMGRLNLEDDDGRKLPK